MAMTIANLSERVQVDDMHVRFAVCDRGVAELPKAGALLRAEAFFGGLSGDKRDCPGYSSWVSSRGLKVREYGRLGRTAVSGLKNREWVIGQKGRFGPLRFENGSLGRKTVSGLKFRDWISRPKPGPQGSRVD